MYRKDACLTTVISNTLHYITFVHKEA